MLVQENVEVISEIVDDLFDFVQRDDSVKNDFKDYLNMMQAGALTPSRMHTLLIPYVFERRIGKKRKSIIELYEENTKKLNKTQKQVLQGLKQTLNSVFEIKKILKNGFEIYNLINESTCNTLSLTKMTQFRGIAVGQYLVARVFPFKDSYYLLEINEIMPASAKESAYRFAVAKQMNEPELLYKGNDKKLKELKKLVGEVGKKFKEFFGTNEVVTSNLKADDLISMFNDYFEGETDNVDKKELEKLIQPPSKWAYFDVKELSGQSGDFLQTAAKGFSSHERVYDVGILFDKEAGLLVIPFYGTFKNIFESEDYKSIEGYKDCILNCLNSPKVPPSVIEGIYNKAPEQFMEIINDTLEEDFDIEVLLNKYKKEMLDSVNYSSTTVLYASCAFQELMQFLDKKEPLPKDLQNTGRNEPCPCGSGKKYKKCCL